MFYPLEGFADLVKLDCGTYLYVIIGDVLLKVYNYGCIDCWCS